MIKFLKKIFCKRKIESSMKKYLILSKEDIDELLKGKTVYFEVEKFLPEIIVCSEEHYSKLMSEVKLYKYD